MGRIMIFIKRDLRFSGGRLIICAAAVAALQLFFRFTALGISCSSACRLSAFGVFGGMFFLYHVLRLESGRETRDFLRRIPLPAQFQVYSKYLLAAALAVTAIAAGSVFLLLEDIGFNLCDLETAFAITIIFHGICLYLFYKNGIQFVQQCYALFFLGLFCMARFQIDIGAEFPAAWVLPALSVIFYIISAKKAVWEVL